ncbi:MAG: hypothetical protein UR85_C0004G0021 [Candidatus Nomurabacteria bacterium GW2011_GWF2_35_66]|uniref:Phosphoribosyltransferase domain-containing protein n=1 Tax=Candidatus Nomurabacteria bacterium GW2011_GWE1_35_16 TaxID=1618761 RepID=A0A0G0BSW1_9BACT|nr:MAG: hypothetical protein UR55_C0002G0020 [Candidatus Nomurabacteria bacterium GW2011_GWF1_34_20]KKP63599.1 MAG: hypothetical protein UR57_C0002G0020 [Candidatus Nomurabacteria bacterium GW2011_GWE2_34_25]KKP66801.1 MAG: hypothetical protein UR64_C0002G0017 [Candidatus Nomurabacteria bacterium GW2011_GWE1_35_16]KKP83427.1 MAG: hypothetical protein UR85_C0004G0021 [Candidatus Nomurabacteria bacterium GW2011_GWF2_35_66]HAE36641.1 hypothetical protein [Candidatus Nomurabacteria bacterium]
MEKAIFIIKKGFNLFLEILFPSKCLSCHLRGIVLCDDCVNKLHLTERETASNVISLYDYRDPIVKESIWKLKYHKTPYIGQRFGQLLYKELIEEVSSLQIFSQGFPILVVPVPISHDKKKNRGYNQSEIIARSFCYSAEKSIFQLKNKTIVKKSNTIPQAKLTNRTRRLQNIKGAFELSVGASVKGKTIIIIDDVTTTGGTMLEMMKVLKKNGAKKVVGFAVAH